MNLTGRKFRLLDGLLIPLRTAPFHTAAILLYTLVAAAVPAFNVGVTSSFINTSLGVLSDGLPIAAVLWPLIGVIAVVAFNTLANNLMQFVRVRLVIRLREPLRKAFLEKRARLAYCHIENQEDWDLISRASDHPEDKVMELLNVLLSVTSLALSTISVMAILITQVWWAGFTIIVISVPLFALSAKGGKKSYEAEREATKSRRKCEYLFTILTGRDTAAERTLFGYAQSLDVRYAEEYERGRLIQYRADRKYFIRMKAGGVATALISVLAALVLAQPVVSGAITVGMFISLVNALFSMAQNMSWGLAGNMQQLARFREYMKDLTAFAALSEEEGGESLPEPAEVFRELAFRNVTFRYPGAETDILRDLSFTLESGKHYSFVGVNGAGKTTITKLITGLFTGYEGQILLNGRDLRDYSQAQLKGFFCGVFQDFARYQLTVTENIALGDAATVEAPDEGKLHGAAELSGLAPAVEKLPRGYNTLLGKLHEKQEADQPETEGVDLSGGEWQRLAMARAVYSPAQVTILDEPTAALDPIAESEVYEKFQELSANRTTIFISHRLGSTLLADTIFVLSEGRITESGSHTELMEQSGLYAEMFESQRSWYR